MMFLAGNFEFDLDRGGQFVVHGQELPTAYMRAKFEDRSFFRLRNIQGSQNFEIWSRTPGHAHLEANLRSGARTAHDLCVCQI